MNRKRLITSMVFAIVTGLSSWFSFAVAGPIVGNCAASDMHFMGVVFHGPVVANGNHNIRQIFGACAGGKNSIFARIGEFEKVPPLADLVNFTAVRLTHTHAVPGHLNEQPNNIDNILPRLSLRPNRPPPVLGLNWVGHYKVSRLVTHIHHHDGAAGLVLAGVGPNPLDISGYLAIFIQTHIMPPLEEEEHRTSPPEVTAYCEPLHADILLGCIAVFDPRNKTTQLALGIKGIATTDIQSAALKQRTVDSAERTVFPLDTEKFASLGETESTYFHENAVLEIENIEDLLDGQGYLEINTTQGPVFATLTTGDAMQPEQEVVATVQDDDGNNILSQNILTVVLIGVLLWVAVSVSRKRRGVK